MPSGSERGGKQMGIWTALPDRIGKLCASVDDAFAVVEHKKNGVVTKNVHDRFEERPFRGDLQPERGDDRAATRPGVRERRQIDEPDAFAASVEQIRRHLQSETRSFRTLQRRRE